ncbi:hypothetical protein [Lentzea sp. CA-135723]|uniref:hypothetical protein n=1 Tax=Lentzea sp. CA-135723 TaxID=3239950 RepID=UPI003D9105D8
MPRHLTMPSLIELPAGPRRDFAELLFRYVRLADRPTLQQISERIIERDDLPGTASKETVRLMLRGKTVPPRWQNAYSVFLVLCDLSGVDPDSRDHLASQGTRDYSRVGYFKMCWNRALDAPPSDPWGEPPF